jgi:hypothetical protein
MRGTPLLLAAVAASGCTLSAGRWFADLEPTFEARYTSRADRDVGGGWQKLNTLYEVRLTRALVTVAGIELQEFGGGGGGGAGTIFDPANPPPGYSLCHNGHCHRDDGALIPYDQIAAELAGGGAAGPRTVVSLPVGEADLLAPARRDLTCDPGCGLPETQVQRARATLTRVVLEGLVREGRLPARLDGEIPWRWDAVLAADTGQAAPVAIDAAVDLAADNAHPPDVQLDLTLTIDARLFDDVEWSALVADAGVVDFSAATNVTGRDGLLGNLADIELIANIERHE